MKRRVSGQLAVVSGAASGIGHVLARELAGRGATLALLDHDRERLDAVAKELGATALCVDVRDDDGVREAASGLVARFGPPAFVFVNAGVVAVGPTCSLPLEDARWVFDVNVVGSLIQTRHFVPPMVAAGRGAVVYTASIAGLLGAPGMSVYGASKFAIRGLADSLRVELHGSGVTVTVLCPGFVRTRLHAATRYHNDGFERFMAASTRRGVPLEKVARRAVTAALRGTPEVVLGAERLGLWVRRWLPGLYPAITHHTAQRLGLVGQEQTS